MATNLALDDRLIVQAQKLGRHRSKRETVNTALKEYVERIKQKEIISLFGKIEFDPQYNYKKTRRR